MPRKASRIRGFHLIAGIVAWATIIAACGTAAVEDTTNRSDETTTTAAATTTAAPTTTAEPEEPIRIGVVTPLTGPVARWGGLTNEGAMLAIDQINEAGGLLGREVQMFIADDQCAPDAAVSATRRLIDVDAVHVIQGGFCSGATLAMMPIVEEAQIPLVNGASSHPDITEQAGVGGNVWVFRNLATDETRTRVIVGYLTDEIGASTFSILNVDNDFGRISATLATEAVTASGGQIVTEDFYNIDETDFRATLTRIKAANPEVILHFGVPSAVAPLVAQMQELDVRIRLAGAAEMVSQDIIDEAGAEFLEGATEALAWSPGVDTAANQEFIEAYRSAYGTEPAETSFGAWETMHIIASAIEAAGSTDPLAIVEALEGLTYDGALGEISFDDHHQSTKPLVLIQIQNGTPVVLGIYSAEGQVG